MSNTNTKSRMSSPEITSGVLAVPQVASLPAYKELAAMRARLKVLETTQRRDRQEQPSHSISKEAGL